VSEAPAALATSFGLSITKANAYLTDLALRQPQIADDDAIAILIELLQTSETVASEKHLSIPLQNAMLRIWLERKLAVERLHPGESLRRDIVKLTPLGLLKLIDCATGVVTPSQALDALNDSLGELAWLEDALDPHGLQKRPGETYCRRLEVPPVSHKPYRFYSVARKAAR
jgi:hypothetical protein